jgi:hypothetical protein
MTVCFSVGNLGVDYVAAPVAAGIGIQASLEKQEVGSGDNLVRIVGPVACVGIFDSGFDLVNKEFNVLSWIKGCTHFGVVVFNVAGHDDSVGCVEVGQNVHGGDAVACSLCGHRVNLGCRVPQRC